MENYIISIEGNLTSHVFYNTLLGKLHDYYVDDGYSPIIFDFTRLKSIDALVIPNLLFVGDIIKDNSDFIPKIIVSDNLSSAQLKSYLHDIKFVYFADKNKSFEFNDAIRSGYSKGSISGLNTTIFFDKKEPLTLWLHRYSNTTYNFTDEYLSEFDVVEKENNYLNILAVFCGQLLENVKRYTNTSAYLTLQYNYFLKKAFISIADVGIGFRSSLNKQIMCKEIERETLLDNEIEAIIEGSFLRRKSNIYGLYNIITKVIEKNGIIRIHSMNSQVVFTERHRLLFEMTDDGVALHNLMSKGDYRRNIRRNLKYGGSHIEIEIPMMYLEDRRKGRSRDAQYLFY